MAEHYQLKVSLKTKILNIFRKVFTIPAFEKILVKLNQKSHSLVGLIPPNYLYKAKTFRLINREGVKYKVDLSQVVDHYLYYGYDESSFDSVLKELKDASVIFDIGANIGTTALYFASMNPKANIFAFEPHPDTFKRIEENIKLNPFSNVSLNNLGLGESKQTLKLYEVNENNAGMNRILSEEKELPYKEIKINSLDDFCEEKAVTNIDFVKIDVEGYEYAVLEGGASMFKKSKPILVIELDDLNLRENNKSAKQLIDLLFSFGYKEIYRASNLQPITAESDFENCHFDIIVK